MGMARMLWQRVQFLQTYVLPGTKRNHLSSLLLMCTADVMDRNQLTRRNSRKELHTIIAKKVHLIYIFYFVRDWYSTMQKRRDPPECRCWKIPSTFSNNDGGGLVCMYRVFLLMICVSLGPPANRSRNRDTSNSLTLFTALNTGVHAGAIYFKIHVDVTRAIPPNVEGITSSPFFSVLHTHAVTNIYLFPMYREREGESAREMRIGYH